MVHWEALPATVKDAIILTEKLEIQFLWVDRLCIVQDDDDSIQQNIASMASIYINSYFTIVVAEGTDADNGLRGIEGTSGPRSYDPYYQFEDLKFCIWEEKEKRSTFHTRAWTFQERAVSRRCIVFFQKTVKWECQVEVLFEHELWNATQTKQLTVESDRDINSMMKTFMFGTGKDGFPRHNISITPWPDVLQFRKLWSGFSGRALSHQEDSLRAFSAILSTFSPSFPGGFLYAIPEFIFDTAITWRHCGRVGPRVSAFPSWSWLGWEGASEMDGWDPTARAKLRTFSQPLARWRKRNLKSDLVEDINNSYYKWDEFAVSTIDEPPQGWKRTTSSRIEGSHYHNDSIRRKDLDHYAQYSFYQPLPIESGSSSPDNTLWDPLLSGTVQAAKMTIGEALGQSQPVELYLYDGSGQWAGIMVTCFNDPQEYTEGDECFVIAICKATRRRVEGQGQPYEEMSTRGEVELEDPYEFIRVLWVEWDGNIAYRRGTGRIWAKAWERQQVREISIVLG
ncbi:MAG: hypothetical protein HETSPECPRED_001218 [Heterodermia speciosa]|uniref:Heterokaryon incompatibility domain-containing protein n=1 Tax=Heterodermia speciosa TaxID=116794 RepID=A0A8H3IED9_9LECA|nr:MAG: hypothetical protein HETSPECPRED_001218 [Heterodermia speciosa]